MKHSLEGPVEDIQDNSLFSFKKARIEQPKIPACITDIAAMLRNLPPETLGKPSVRNIICTQAVNAVFGVPVPPPRLPSIQATLSLNIFHPNLIARSHALSNFEGKPDNDVEVTENHNQPTPITFKKFFPVVDDNDSDATELEDDVEEEKFHKFADENSVSLIVSETKDSKKDICARTFEAKVSNTYGPVRQGTNVQGNTLWQRHREDRFDEMFIELKKYKQVHGDCMVPHTSGRLGGWVKRIRDQKKQGKLSPERIKKLSDIGFAWVVRNRVPFEERIQELQKFKEKHGHTRVPLNSGPLGDWVSNMRIRRKKNGLKYEHVSALDAIGFCWDASEYSGNPRRKSISLSPKDTATVVS